jgi:hypothetical protein
MSWQPGLGMLDRRQFLQGSAAGCLFTAGAAHARAAEESKPSRARDVASETQLFLDDWLVERISGLQRVLHQPEKKGLIQNADGSPWDRGDCYAADGNLVCRDSAGRFHMTYRYIWFDPALRGATPAGDDKAHWFHQLTAYATSDDGIRWHKPKLGLVNGPTGFRKQEEFPFEVPSGMSKENNLGCPFDFIWDLGNLGGGADPRKRFLLRVVKKNETHPFAKILESQMYFAADWPDFANDPKWKEKLTPIPGGRLSPRGFKTLAGFDPQAKVFFQVCQDHLGHWVKRGGRDIARYTSPDLVTWSGPELVLPVAKDESRDVKDWVEYMFLYAHRVGGPRSGAWLGQLEIFHADRTNPQYEVPIAGVWRKGTTELRLVISRDAGRSWQRVGERQVWLPHHRDPHGFDRLVFGATPVRVKDELWFYYPAWDGDHLSFNKDGSLYEPGFLRTNRTARATLRVDGYVSLDAGKTAGEVVTKPLTFAGRLLVVNANVSQGELRAELQDASGKPVPGWRLEDSVPIARDGLALPVRWRGKPDAEKPAVPVRVRFVLTNASLYSFRFV